MRSRTDFFRGWKVSKVGHVTPHDPILPNFVFFVTTCCRSYPCQILIF